MTDHPTPFPSAGDPLAERYAELRKLGWQPSAAFLRAYEEQFARQARGGRAWHDTDDTTTPDGGVA